MRYEWWIYILTFITRGYSQCSGSTSKSTVGYAVISVNSPNYNNGYSKHLACSWQHSTSVTGASLLIQINATIDCPGDVLLICEGTDITGSILHTCTTSTPSYVVASTGSIYTSFTTDSTSSASEKGFQFNVITAKDFSSSACTSTKTVLASTNRAYISSPDFPNPYPADSDCSWRIERTDTTNPMELSFTFIDIEYENSGPCSYDYVQITDDATGTTVLTTCGNNQWFPSQTYTTKGNVTVKFHSDATQNQRGFLLAYYVLSTSSDDDDTSCVFDNCVILPVLITVCGIVLIAIIAGIIICTLSKNYVVPHISTRGSMEASLHLPKTASLLGIILPPFGYNKQRTVITSRAPVDVRNTLIKEKARKKEARRSKFKSCNNKISASAAANITKPNTDAWSYRPNAENKPAVLQSTSFITENETKNERPVNENFHHKDTQINNETKLNETMSFNEFNERRESLKESRQSQLKLISEVKGRHLNLSGHATKNETLAHYMNSKLTKTVSAVSSTVLPPKTLNIAKTNVVDLHNVNNMSMEGNKTDNKTFTLPSPPVHNQK